MIKIERTFTINLPLEEVFAYLSAVEHGPCYTAGQREAHISSTGPIGVGTTFVISGKFVHRSVACVFTNYEPDRRFAWDTRSGARATTSWDFQPRGSGTQVAFVYTQQPSGYGWFRLPEWLQQERANERVDRDLWTLKELLAPSKREAKGWSYQVPAPAERTSLAPVGVSSRPIPTSKKSVGA